MVVSPPAKIMCLVGTRPECVKMAPVIAAMRAAPDMQVRVVSTGQHKELIHQTLGIFGIEPDVDLAVMTANQSLAALSARIFDRLDPLLVDEAPDMLLAQGDTASVMVAALNSFFRKIPFGHVEAGLRTGDLQNPFPEELNRVVAGIAADIHFAPTQSSRLNLLREHVPDERIHVTGNTVIDALKWVTAKPLACEFPRDKSRRLILVTAHRRENFGVPFERICAALRQLHDELTDAEFVYPVHPNPNVRSVVMPALSDLPRFHLIDPVDYLTMAGLLQAASVIVTDSGGIQEEAPALAKPVLVLRHETERPEAVDAGVARLVGTDPATIIEEVRRVWTDQDAYRSMASGISPYGDGHAAGRIVAACRDFLSRRREGAAGR